MGRTTATGTVVNGRIVQDLAPHIRILTTDVYAICEICRSNGIRDEWAYAIVEQYSPAMNIGGIAKRAQIRNWELCAEHAIATLATEPEHIARCRKYL